ncbi:MAG: hypothetical protein QOH13_482, partial [Thermoleophilaceae bacterium]|nr:hypothetical protein [Thermoleophilaceae bacterium]
METACQSHFRRLALGLMAAVVAFVAMLGIVAKADAGLYVLPDPPLKAKTVNEGGTAAWKIKLTCPFAECDYRISTAPGTAKADGSSAGNRDYNPFAYYTIALEKGKSKVVVFRAKTLTDDVCEKSEYFTVRLQGEWQGINDRYGGPPSLDKKAKVTIRNQGCLFQMPATKIPNRVPTNPTPAPAPAPAPDPAPAPAPSPAPAPAPAPTPNNTNGNS